MHLVFPMHGCSSLPERKTDRDQCVNSAVNTWTQGPKWGCAAFLK